MASKARSQDAFVDPQASPEDSIQEDKISGARRPTVYDAVAGRIAVTGFRSKRLRVSSDGYVLSSPALPPEAVLFRGRNAPTRYAESDFYFANERESPKDLPGSDLLKALHCYASDFYSKSTMDGGAGDWRSLDETALIALGILMDEASRSILGETGDLVFTEGEEVDDSSNKAPIRDAKTQNDTTLKPKNARPRKKRRILEDSNMD